MVERVQSPNVRGFHWSLRIARVESGATPTAIPADTAPPGRRPPPLLRAGAERFGLDGETAAAPAVARPRAEPPPPNPLAVELQGAKEYIASLEQHIAGARGARGGRCAGRCVRVRVMRVLIVGGAGYVGGWLTDRALEAGHDVRVYDLLLYEDRYLKEVPFVTGDVLDRERLRPAPRVGRRRRLARGAGRRPRVRARLRR